MVKTVSEQRLLKAPESTVIEKVALEFAAVFYDAARSSGSTSKLTQRVWARKNFQKFIPPATKHLISMLGRSDIADLMKQEIHQALLERVNDPEVTMLDELAHPSVMEHLLWANDGPNTERINCLLRSFLWTNYIEYKEMKNMLTVNTGFN